MISSEEVRRSKRKRNDNESPVAKRPNNLNKKLDENEEKNDSPLSAEDVKCNICFSIYIEPVTLSCNHSLCLKCYMETIKNASVNCPFCRKRITNCRRNKKENKLVNMPFWEKIKRQFPKRVAARLNGEETQEFDLDDSQEDPEDDRRFELNICPEGEIGKELQSELEKVRLENERKAKEEEEASIQFIHELQRNGEADAPSSLQSAEDLARDEEFARQLEAEEREQERAERRAKFSAKIKETPKKKVLRSSFSSSRIRTSAPSTSSASQRKISNFFIPSPSTSQSSNYENVTPKSEPVDVVEGSILDVETPRSSSFSTNCDDEVTRDLPCFPPPLPLRRDLSYAFMSNSTQVGMSFNDFQNREILLLANTGNGDGSLMSSTSSQQGIDRTTNNVDTLCGAVLHRNDFGNSTMSDIPNTSSLQFTHLSTTAAESEANGNDGNNIGVEINNVNSSIVVTNGSNDVAFKTEIEVNNVDEDNNIISSQNSVEFLLPTPDPPRSDSQIIYVTDEDEEEIIRPISSQNKRRDIFEDSPSDEEVDVVGFPERNDFVMSPNLAILKTDSQLSQLPNLTAYYDSPQKIKKEELTPKKVTIKKDADAGVERVGKKRGRKPMPALEPHYEGLSVMSATEKQIEEDMKMALRLEREFKKERAKINVRTESYSLRQRVPKNYAFEIDLTIEACLTPQVRPGPSKPRSTRPTTSTRPKNEGALTNNKQSQAESTGKNAVSLPQTQRPKTPDSVNADASSRNYIPRRRTRFI